ncbi:MAG TPA: hypothetical protein VJ729_04230 [Nitrososphaeraceae archaeon]|nr:hypothetical protein [Nitrososphaeraceae archaeon]
MSALMRVFTTNGTSIRSSPADLGFIGNNNTSNTSTNVVYLYSPYFYFQPTELLNISNQLQAFEVGD